MYPLRERRTPGFSSRTARRPGLILESLESRRMLSTAGSSTTLTPAAAAVISDLVESSSPAAGPFVTNPTPLSSALTPSQLATAYSISLSSTTGSGETIAIVDAYNDPNIQADLAVFDAQYKLAAASLTVMNQYGQTTNLPRTDADWSLEIALDVEWAHAAAPGAKIVLVEANSASISDLMAAVQTAAKLANVVSMSWGGSEFQGEAAYDTAAYFGKANVTFVAASGDNGGATGAEWPAVSPDVVSVGGTTLMLTSTGAIKSETAWSATGSLRSGSSGSTGGASRYEVAPSYQITALGSSVTRRLTPDVASDGNPSTGLSVYDSVAGAGQTGWSEVGGTSAGAPVWAGIVAAADQARSAAGLAALSSTQTLSLLYGLSSTTAYSADFHDITSGSNFAASAKAGYDMVTGLGSPVASRLIAAASTSTTTASAVKTAATTTTSTTATTATHAAPHTEQAASSIAAVAAAGSTAVAVFLSVDPATTAGSTAAPIAGTSSQAATALPAAPARPAQPLDQPNSVPLSAGDEETLLAPSFTVPSGPGLFLDPAQGVPELDDEAPGLVDREPALDWDSALESFLTEEDKGIASPTSGPPVLGGEPATDELASSGPVVALAGLAVAIWGVSASAYRKGRIEGDSRQRSRSGMSANSVGSSPLEPPYPF